MPGRVVDFPTVVDELVAALLAAGVREVTTEPEDLNLPGVLVQVRTVRPDLLAGSTYVLAVLCIDSGAGRVRDTMTALSDLATLVLTVVDPAADITSGTVALTEGTAPHPCLEITVEMEQ